MCRGSKVKRRLVIAVLMQGLMIMLNPPMVLPSACVADLDGNGRVNDQDETIMNGELGRLDCAAIPCRSDLNGDGKVTSGDKEMLASELGREDCEPDSGGVQEGAQTVTAGPERFQDNQDGTVTDRRSGLVWTKNANIPGDTLLFHEALAYTRQMNNGVHVNFGQSDWRLPTMNELRSLLDYTTYTINGHGLPKGHPFEKVQQFEPSRKSQLVYLSRPASSTLFSLYCRAVRHNTQLCSGYLWPVRGSSINSLSEREGYSGSPGAVQ